MRVRPGTSWDGESTGKHMAADELRTNDSSNSMWCSAVGFAAMANGSNPDAHRDDADPAGPGFIDNEIKEQTVIAAA